VGRCTFQRIDRRHALFTPAVAALQHGRAGSRAFALGAALAVPLRQHSAVLVSEVFSPRLLEFDEYNDRSGGTSHP
jgi:hypothetical protein